MHYTRVLGTVGLIGATVLGAMGPSAVSHAASATKTSTAQTTGSGVSANTAVRRFYAALSSGYAKTNKKTLGVPLSSQFRQNFHTTGSMASTLGKRAGAASAAHTDSQQPNLSGGARTNQDFGFYNTGNGVLYHNNPAVATDPNDALHVVVSGTDTRLGSDSSVFDYSSSNLTNATSPACLFSPTGGAGTAGGGILGGGDITGNTTPCGLIDTLGGPGIYDSIDGARTFTDLIIPDTLTGAVPDAIILDSTFYGTVNNSNTLTGDLLRTTAGNPYPGGTFLGATTSTATPPVVTAATNTVADSSGFVAAEAAIGCIAAGGGTNGVGGTGSVNLFNQPGFPNACLPYDSVGNQTVAFDRAGNLYSVGLGLITSNPIVGSGPAGLFGNPGTGLTGLPQTDVLLNVSPAIQPIGQVGNAPGANGTAYVQTSPPDAAGRVFNATPPYSPAFTLPGTHVVTSSVLGCDPTQSSTTVCLHNEVIATNTVTNMVDGGNPNVIMGGSTIGIGDAAAQQVGRNYRADAASTSIDSGAGLCGTVDFCIIDTPALAIDNVIDSKAFVTYTVIDFGGTTTPREDVTANVAALPFPVTSNIFLTTATVPDTAGLSYTGDPGYSGGTLPKWTPPVRVDNSHNNPFCFGLSTTTTGSCTSSYGASTAIGPDGSAYIAYLNDDPSTFFNTTISPSNPAQTALLVAGIGANGTSIGSTTLAAFVINHDEYNSINGFQPENPAGLDPASGAYFTIANRPTIAVTEGVAEGGKLFPGGLVIVAWTDQRSLLSNGTVSLGRGTRVWYTVGAAKSSQSLLFNVISPTAAVGNYTNIIPTSLAASVPDTSIVGAATTATGFGGIYGSGPGTYNIAEVYEPNPSINPSNPGGFVNQFFPAIVADQSSTAVASILDNVFVGFYQETPGTVTFSGLDNLFTSTATLAFLVGKSQDFGNTFGIQQANVLMPLPNPPLSPAYCSYQYGYQYQSGTGLSSVRPGVTLASSPFGTQIGTPLASSAQAASACNAVPYFGNSIGAAAGSTDSASNDAYFAFTNTQADTRDFNVQGSQNIYTLHAS